MAYFYNRFCKWVTNINSWTQMSWRKTNFNMPVPNLYDDTTWWVSWAWVFTYHETNTTFDLAWFNYWWEVIVAATWIHWEDLEWWDANHTFTQTWKDTLWATIFTNSRTIFMDTPWVGLWQEEQLLSNQWVAPWEINISWTYTLTASVSWPTHNFSTDFNVDFTSVPAFPWYKDPWYIWIEGTWLHYIWSDWFEHNIVWDNLWASWWDTWALWINDSLIDTELLYTDSTGIKRTNDWYIEQFPSSFSNGATTSVSWQTAGYVYIDTEFWDCHISYIANDWKKYLVWDWNYPYVIPY